MRRLSMLAMLLLISALSLIASVRLIGRAMGGRDPLPDVGFEVCGGKPCYLGLVPGETRWDRVKPTLEQHGVAFHQSDSTFTTKFDILTDQWLIEIISSAQRQRVMYILWVYRGAPLSLGDFILLYGQPCRAFVSQRNDSLIANFHNLSLNVQSYAHHRFNAQAAVYGFTLSDYLPPGCEQLATS
jgi:hypothetical protein